MRVLVFQTPKLSYVQTMEFLLRETQQRVDLAILPEFAVEQPAQCTNQAELSYDNVSIMMLSRLAKQRQIYLVLGSVEERCAGSVFDTCVVFNRNGEMIMRYRKSSERCESVFQTEYGPVAVLLGAEIDDERRWEKILQLSPVLILNPCNAPMELDTALAKAHPELQVAAWHKGFRRLEALVQARLRGSGAWSFVRADAPLRQGGAGLSILVEANRSVMAPSWAPSFFALEVKEVKALPKWREITVEEIIQAASSGSRRFRYEEGAEIGPRYRVWTLRPPHLAKAAMNQTAEWCQLWQNDENLEIEQEPGLRRSSFLLPLTSRDGRHLYVVAAGSTVTLWDLRQRREWQSFGFGEASSVSSRSRGRYVALPFAELLRQAPRAAISALGRGQGAQFVVAGQVEDDDSDRRGAGGARESGEGRGRRSLLLQLYEEKKLLQDFAMNLEDFPWHEWKPYPTEDPDEEPELLSPETHTVSISCIFWSSRSQLVAIAEAPHKPEVVLLIDLEKGSVKILDIYGNGPPRLEVVEEQGHGSVETQESLSAPTGTIPAMTTEEETRDRLVMVQNFEKQRFPESKGLLTGLVCLWKSDRLSILTYSDWKIHDQVLVDDSGAKDRLDMPLCAAIVSGEGALSVIASYASMIIRWWRVSLKSSFQQACVVLTSPVTSLSPWAQLERSERSELSSLTLPPLPFERLAERSLERRAELQQLQQLQQHSSERSEQRRSLLSTESQSAGGAAGGAGSSGLRRPSGSGSQSLSVATRRRLSREKCEALAESAATLWISAVDTTGAMTIFVGQGANLKKVYACSDFSRTASTIVDCIWTMETHIALLQRNGDVRHIEFDLNGELMRLCELFDQPKSG